MQKTIIEIDGFPLTLKRTAHGARLAGDPERKLYDGQDSSLLNTPISMVANPLNVGQGNWAKILAGDGFTYGVAGCVPAEKYKIDSAEAIVRFVSTVGKQPDGPMWYVFSEELGHTFIPYGTLKTILELAIDVANGKDVELPEHAIVGPTSETDAKPVAPACTPAAPAERAGIAPETARELDRLLAELASMVQDAQPRDVEAQAAITARRRRILDDLEVHGLLAPDAPNTIDAEQMSAQGLPHLARYCAGIRRLHEYLASAERARFNKQVERVDLRRAAVSVEWFQNNMAPEEFSDFDWLSRCESIYTEQGLSSVGFVYRRIGNYQVKLSNAYEDGVNLKLVSAEVVS